MALQVWLPLTKDLRNQGLGSVQTTNNTNFILKSGGKLGALCLDLSNTVRLYSPNLVNLKTFSFAFWYRPETSESTINWNDVIGFNDSKGGLFRLETSYSNSYMLSMHNNTQYGIIQNVGASYGNTLLLSSASYSRDVWYHIAVTVEENDNVKAYVNGELKCIVARSDGSITGYFNLGELGGSNKEDGGLNDLRIYDHCLSPMEVKELAKGLVLHYPLNRNGWGQENLILESHKVTGGGNANGITRTYESDGSMKIVSTSGNGNWCSLSFAKDSNTNVGNNMAVGDTYCISCDVKIETGTVLPTLFINSGNGYKQLRPINGSLITGQWIRVYYNSTWADPGTGYGNISLHLGFSGIVGTYYFKNFKLEKSSTPTLWCPNIADSNNMGLNGTIEYDCSGFCNNGTRTGTFSWTSDTPKYAVSTAIEKGIITSANSFITVADPIFSVALWFKLKSEVTYTAYTDLISFSSSSYSNQPFRLEICGSPVGKSIMWFRGPSGQSGGFAVKSDLSFDTWYHTVLVSEGNKQYSYYVNGIKLGTYNGSANSWTPTGNVSLGENLNGVIYESDFRIYATALSADDVKSLYQNCATIDPDGTIRGQIRS